MQEFTSELPEGEEPEFNPLAGVKFMLDGTEFECSGALSVLENSELADMATAGVTADSQRGSARLARSLRLALGDEEYERFRAHCLAPPRTPDKVILGVMQAINSAAADNIEAEADRPTEPSVPSSGGPQETDGRTSRVMKLGGDVTAVPPPTGMTPAARARRKGTRPVSGAVTEAAEAG